MKTPTMTVAAFKALATKSMPEDELLRNVLRLAAQHGWRTAHFRAGMLANGEYRTAVSGDGAGFPDVLMVRDGRLVAAELKSAKGVATEQQLIWLNVLEVAGVECFLWRPSEWVDGTIERTLR